MRIEKLLKTLKREFIKVNLIQASLDSLLFFLGSNLVLFLLDLQLISSFKNIEVVTFLTLLFLIGDLLHRVRKYRLELYEKENPELREILRTARDNLDQQNIVSQALFDEVLQKARTISSDSIIPSKQIIQKILVVGLLSFLTVLSGLADFQLQQDGGELIQGGEDIRDLLEGKDKQKNEDGYQLRNSSEIFGDSREISSSDLDINFSIQGSGESSGESVESSDSGQEEILLDVSGTSSSEDLELAKKYSLAIKDLEG